MKVSLRTGWSGLFLGYIILLIAFKASNFDLVLSRAFAASYMLASIVAIIFCIRIFTTSHKQTRKIISYFIISLIAFIAYSTNYLFTTRTNFVSLNNSVSTVFMVLFFLFQLFAWAGVVDELLKPLNFRQTMINISPVIVVSALITFIAIIDLNRNLDVLSFNWICRILEILLSLVGFVLAVFSFTVARFFFIRILSTGYLFVLLSGFALTRITGLSNNLYDIYFTFMSIGIFLMCFSFYRINSQKIGVKNWIYDANTIQTQFTSGIFILYIVILGCILGLLLVLVPDIQYQNFNIGLVISFLLFISIIILWFSYIFTHNIFKPMQKIKDWVIVNPTITDLNQIHLLSHHPTLEYKNLGVFMKNSINDKINNDTVNSLHQKDEAMRASMEMLQNHESFERVVEQMVHDIQSPLSSLRTVVDGTNEIPEQKRVLLRTSTMNISDITNQLLNKYRNMNNEELNEVELPTNILVSSILSEIASDRRYKYKDQLLDFEFKLNNMNAFIFIRGLSSDFKRSISNLVNNATDALADTGGKVELRLKANEEWVYISVLDYGCGMNAEQLKKIKDGISFSAGKSNGHGIGLTQVRGMLERNHGEFKIFSSDSGENRGTTVELKFPRVNAPAWIVDEIIVYPNDTIVILDDDEPIHAVINGKLSHIVEKFPDIKIQHFTQGNAALEFIKKFENKERVYFLCDYELIGQDKNGLSIIRESGIKRSTLITNYHADSKINKLAIEAIVKILPKDLFSAVRFNLIQESTENTTRKVDMVFLDDEKLAMDTLVSEYYNDLIIDQYTNPFEFMDQVAKYSYDTIIVLDNYFYAPDGSTYKIDGLTIARQLHDKGYQKLILLSGESFDVPDYLRLVLKSDRTMIRSLDQV